jgi:nitrite reductase/ring-hydroxylating ferredoxin subunit
MANVPPAVATARTTTIIRNAIMADGFRDKQPGPDSDLPTAGREQSLVGFRSNDEWDGLLQEVDRMLATFESHPDATVKADVFSLLDGIDTIHREALTRLVRLFKEGVLEKVITDPAIRTLMELYDLLPKSDEKGCGGDVPDFITGFPPPKREPARVDRAVGENAVQEKVPLPHWLPVLASVEDLKPGQVAVRRAAESEILLCRVGEQIFALAKSCARDGASLDGARLDQFVLACPTHAGCYYDVRQGTRIGGGAALECLPVRIEESRRVLIGINVPFRPELPTF